MKEIQLTQGKTAFVDSDVYENLILYNWHFTHYGYAGRKASTTEVAMGLPSIILMHRQILGHPLNMDIDHRDLNKLNNLKSNLRICTKKENNRNMGPRNNGKTSSYKGVSWAKDRNKWRAFIYYQDKRIAIGSFDSEIEAAQAYNQKAFEYFGEYAWLNIIE